MCLDQFEHRCQRRNYPGYHSNQSWLAQDTWDVVFSSGLQHTAALRTRQEKVGVGIVWQRIPTSQM